MPYGQKRVYRRRRRYNRKRPVKAQNSYLSTAAKALAVAYGVKKLVNAEKFHFDASANATILTTAQITPLQLIAEGDDISNRQGRSIKLTGLLMKLVLASAVAATQTSIVRCMLVIDRWSTGVVPAIGDILVSTTVTSFRQVDSVNARRFKVLMDRNVRLGVEATDNSEYTISKYFPVKHHVKYINTTGVQAATGAGQIYFIVFADQVAANACGYTLNTRSWYYDN